MTHTLILPSFPDKFDSDSRLRCLRDTERFEANRWRSSEEILAIIDATIENEQKARKQSILNEQKKEGIRIPEDFIYTSKLINRPI